MNLLNKVRNQLGFPEFVKVDPNTQHVKDEAHTSSEQRLGQATITSVVTAVYLLSRTEEGFGYLVNRNANEPWKTLLFKDEAEGVANSIASYSGADIERVNESIEAAGNATWEEGNRHLDGKVNYQSFGKYISSVRNDLLVYLPPDLHLGRRLNNDSLDDRTNKMEGPVSGFMHKIERILSGPQEHERLDNF